MEKSTEIMFQRKKIQELTQDKQEIDEVKDKMSLEKNEITVKLGREIKNLKERL